MTEETGNRFHLGRLRLDIGEVRAVVPEKIKKRNEHFVRMPWTWIRRLPGATSSTWIVAFHVLYLDWSNKGQPFKLPNGLLKIDGVSPPSKRRALRGLERRGLITVEWRPRKSPIVRRLM